MLSSASLLLYKIFLGPVIVFLIIISCAALWNISKCMKEIRDRNKKDTDA